MQLRLNDLRVDYVGGDGGVLMALGPLSLTIEQGSFVCVLGPSGCGKSTLIRVLAGLQEATVGQAYVGDERVIEPPSAVGLMFQDANLMPWRTVQDNIALPLELAGIPKRERHASVMKMLIPLGLEGFAEAYPAQLSGGMAQRVALGRVLIQRPEVLLLDEPFGALDAMTREKISLDLLRLWNHAGQTVLMVTHDIHEAVMLADRIVVLSQRPGRIVADIAVHLERPRDLNMTYTEHFAQVARAVRNAIDAA